MPVAKTEAHFNFVDSLHMGRALRLAARGLNTVSPNPRVGCVLVRDGRVVGEGWHERAGEPHAEVHALAQAGAAAQGATAYVTLEPCSHHGRTPPCADALIRAGVSRVVAAVTDPNPQVAGSGLARLAAAGIRVESGLMQAAATDLNRGFFQRMQQGRPWVTLKLAASLDGRTAMANGESKWITSEAARQDVQRLRARSCAVLTGIGTVLADDPSLNVRLAGATRQPLRVVLDSNLRTPPTSRLLSGGNTLIYTVAAPSQQLDGNVVEVARLPGNQPELQAVLADLARRGVNEVLVEAGQTLAGAFLAAGLVDTLIVYLAPTLLGSDGRGLAALPGIQHMADRLVGQITEVRQVGPDLRLTLTMNSSVEG